MNIDWGHEKACAHGAIVPLLPQSAWCLAPGPAMEKLADCLFDTNGLNSCRIVNVNYRPPDKLDVVYEFSATDNTTKIASLTFGHHEEIRRTCKKFRKRAGNAASVRYLPTLDAVAVLFPEDAQLPWIAALANSDATIAMLQSCTAPTWPLPDARQTLLSYRPGRRCTMRIRAPTQGIDVIAKMQRDIGTAHDAICRLHTARRTHFSVPAPIAYDAQRHLRWEQYVRGITFTAFAARHGAARAVQLIVGSLAELHRTRIGTLPSQSAEKVCDRLQNMSLKRIDCADIESHQLCRNLAVELIKRQPSPAESCTLHGDLHTANVLFRDETVVFIDLEEMASGDSAFDLAVLGSRLLLLQLVGYGSVDANTLALVATIPQLYEASGGVPITANRFAWFLAALLVGRQIKTCINNAAPALDETTSALACAAKAILMQEKFDPDTVGPILQRRAS